jgi:hypothetical protein
MLGYPVKRKRNLGPYPADRMKAWPIGARVNSPKNDDTEIVCRSSFNRFRFRKISRNCCDRASIAGTVMTIRWKNDCAGALENYPLG